MKSHNKGWVATQRDVKRLRDDKRKMLSKKRKRIQKEKKNEIYQNYLFGIL